MSSYENALLAHYQQHWGLPTRQLFHDRGPVHELPLGFSVLEFKVGLYWRYATIGLGVGCGFELFLIAPRQDEHHVHTAAVVSHYAMTGPGLGCGHTVFLGEAWLPESICDHLLLSRPYADEPTLASFEFQDRRVLCLWLLPITREEREFKVRCGLDALENVFEDKAIEYANPDRQSLV